MLKKRRKLFFGRPTPPQRCSRDNHSEELAAGFGGLSRLREKRGGRLRGRRGVQCSRSGIPLWCVKPQKECTGYSGAATLRLRAPGI